ncbi:hypothetical protein CR513_10622, partial [Mucuna pruriens]
MVNEIGVVDNLRLENQLTELTSLVRQLEHPTDMCPTLQETELDYLESVGAIGGYQYEKQPYQSRLPFRPGPSLGPYAVERFRSTLNAPQRPTCYQEPTL